MMGFRHGRPGTTAGCLAYLTREGVGEDGGRGRLFDAYGHEPQTQVFIDEARRDPQQYLLLFSPETRTIELRTFSREVVTQLSRNLDQNLVWLAASHLNSHPHTHVVLRGRGRAGEPMVIDRGFVQGDL